MPKLSDTKIVAIGECMVELSRGEDGRYGLAYGGDTFNTAVYLARAGCHVAYATALGDDPYSTGILDLARREGIDTGLVAIRPGRMPGLYLIETTATGERTFHYWRDRAPARELLDTDLAAAALGRALGDCRLVYLSGITLSLYADAALDRLAHILAGVRACGGLVAMDGNFRPRGWGGDVDRARSVLSRFWHLADLALPSFDDEAALWGDPDPGTTVSRLLAHGVRDVAVKLGGEGAVVGDGSAPPHRVPVPAPVAAIDTTAAGDSFNAAWLAARLSGASLVAATEAGHRLAAVVVRHRGAIVPAEATRRVLASPTP